MQSISFIKKLYFSQVDTPIWHTYLRLTEQLTRVSQEHGAVHVTYHKVVINLMGNGSTFDVNLAMAIHS